jgi:hypothetical protein
MKSKVSGSLILIVLFLSLIVSVQAKPEPIVEKIVFTHRLDILDISSTEKAAKPAGGSKPLYKWSGLHWDDLALSYVIDTSGSGLDPKIASETLIDSFETWDTETGAEVFVSGTIGDAEAGVLNGVNELGFGLTSQGTIAVTYIWYNRLTKEVVEVDTLFNTYYSWSTSGEVGKMDLQNIATHEFGHWLVLDDLYTKQYVEQTMYGYSGYGETKKRTLEGGDISGIEAIYGP